MSTLSIPAAILTTIHDDVLYHGTRDCETGMFLLAPRGATNVTTLAMPGTIGVTRSREQFALTGSAINRLFRYARAHKLEVLAQIHSHGGEAFLSEVDLRYGFAVEGFTTSVIPTYRRPPLHPAAWGWWRHDGHAWHRAAPYLSGEGDAAIVTFDEESLHAR
jgi:proteasome lid subunit RPN8/RPN11